ncbi:MAG TPA: acyl carrier protein [Fulvivirga sp.]|nr:acyl carrier protein [Fulvivirga sp.]
MEQFHTQQQIEQYLKLLISKEIGCNVQEIKATDEFVIYGFDSFDSILLLDRLEKVLDLDLNPMLFWEYPTIKKLSARLSEIKKL